MQIKDTILVGLTAEEINVLEDFVLSIDNYISLYKFSLEDLKTLLTTGSIDVSGEHFEIDVNY